MASGRDRSPSPSIAAGRHRIEREELLAGGSNPVMLDVSDAISGVSLRVSKTRMVVGGGIESARALHSPRGGRIGLHSPRSGSPLPSPRGFEPIMDSVDCEERGVLPAQRSLVRVVDDVAQLHGDVFSVSRKCRLDPAEQQQRSPYSSRRFKEDVVLMEAETLPLSRNWNPDGIEIGQEKTFSAAHDCKMRRSPVDKRIDMVEMQGTEELPAVRPSCKATKSYSRRSKTLVFENKRDDHDMGDRSTAAKHGHSRKQTRQHKRKAPDLVPVLHHDLPESYPHVRSRLQSHEYSRSSSRRTSRGMQNCLESSDWLQLLVDIILWRHVPRSSLLFGVGCFCIFSASVIHDINYNIVTILAYFSLFYLGAAFFRYSIGHGEISQSSRYEICEADALKVIRAILPAINFVLRKMSLLFSGEPAMTLKVAMTLWLLAQSGYIMNLWTLARLAYFALFIIPKCCLCYQDQLRGYTQSLLLWCTMTWNSCSHKKAILFAAFAVAWNFFSISSCIFGVFILVVALRTYRQSFGIHEENGSTMPNEADNRPSD
eukprot:c18017_g1_i1 orf=221-1849(+)